MGYSQFSSVYGWDFPENQRWPGSDEVVTSFHDVSASRWGGREWFVFKRRAICVTHILIKSRNMIMIIMIYIYIIVIDNIWFLQYIFFSKKTSTTSILSMDWSEFFLQVPTIQETLSVLGGCYKFIFWCAKMCWNMLKQQFKTQIYWPLCLIASVHSFETTCAAHLVFNEDVLHSMLKVKNVHT